MDLVGCTSVSADFDNDGDVDIEDMILLSNGWDADDASKDIGPAKGTPPELEPMLDKNLDFEDLGVFIVMWNWSHSNIQPQTPPFDSAMDIDQEIINAVRDGIREGVKAKLSSGYGSPMDSLVKAALDAVQNWRYQPTVLNGEPVEVDTTIDVNFVLGG